jgi:hypothetical protein
MVSREQNRKMCTQADRDRKEQDKRYPSKTHLQ